MKIKLLKKLRKEANRKYRVIKDMGGWYMIQELYGIADFVDVRCGQDKKYIIKELNRYKRKYILDTLDAYRKAYPRIIA